MNVGFRKLCELLPGSLLVTVQLEEADLDVSLLDALNKYEDLFPAGDVAREGTEPADLQLARARVLHPYYTYHSVGIGSNDQFVVNVGSYFKVIDGI